jgi:hypothetical protein
MPANTNILLVRHAEKPDDKKTPAWPPRDRPVRRRTWPTFRIT